MQSGWIERDAQAIVDRVAAGQTVAQVSALRGGAIGAIYEIGLTHRSVS